jgi:drug/metabolite transporter (DMT)-like permease
MAIAAALLAILLWASLATLSVSLAALPPLFLIGCALLAGGALSLPWARLWSLNWRTIALGCYGLFCYHLLFILALRYAPPIRANLVQYSWPMLVVLLSPLMLRGYRLGVSHVIAALTGFGGAAIAITAGSAGAPARWEWGYAFALGAALVWSTYSLALKRQAQGSTADVGLACIVSGLFALAAHALLEPAATLSSATLARVIALGVGPMGAAFYLWGYALRHGDPRVIGVLANATPLLSTLLLVAQGSGAITPALMLAALLVSGASLLVFVAPLAARKLAALRAE